ncbi:MAG: hypothetical protein Q9207_003872 [Kuettlingeria erythrocarpa]
MPTEEGASPRLFDASDGQADMTWLESQHDYLEVPVNSIPRTSTGISQDSPQYVEKAEKTETVSTKSESELAPGLVKQEPAHPEHWSFSGDVVDLTDDTTHVKQEDCTEPMKDWKAMPSYIDLLDSENELVIKQEPPAEPFEDWKAMPSHIDLSDTEDELDLVDSTGGRENSRAAANHQAQQQGRGVDAKGKGPESVQAKDSDSNSAPTATIINLSTSILRTPNSKAKRAAMDPAKVREAIALHRARALKRDRDLAVHLSAAYSSSLGENPSDSIRVVEDDYLSPVNNVMEGDQSDSLFLPEEWPRSKRPHAATVENDSEIEEIDGNTVLNTKGKPKRKRQAKFQPKGSEEMERLRELEEEASLAIGLERFNNAHNNGTSRSQAIPATYDGRPGAKGKRKETKGVKPAKPKAKRQPKKDKKGKKRNNNDANIGDVLEGLQSHDVLAEANANLDRAALPTIHGTSTRNLLQSLLQSIPDDERPGVRGEQARLGRAAHNFGHGVVKGFKDGWRFKGMKSLLLHHQLLGASFMRDRELGQVQPYGGLLADEMGFGKTVMMIATMVTNPPGPSDKARSTLIVCSNSLLLQWRRELANHAQDGIFNTIIIHHGHSQIEGDGLEAVLSEADVVLTTYGQVVKSFPLQQPPEHLEHAERKAWWEKHWGDQKGLLHKTHFFRVVLDESQVIKNHKSHTSLACQALMAHHRWAISGTPILNRIEEFYPYFKFLRAPFAGTFDKFRLNFCGKGDRVYTDRLHSLLQQFMLRRTHRDLIFGKPIIKLPECHTETLSLRPTKVEMSIYRALEFRYVQAVNAVAKWGSEQQIHRATMTMLTRLRQMTAHLFLVQQVMQDMFELDDVEQLRDLIKEDSHSQDMLMAIQALTANKEDDEEPDDDFFAQSNNETQDFSPPSAALLLKFQNHLKSLISNSDASEFAKRSTCPRCGQPPEEPQVTSCLHVYCRECLLFMGHEAGLADEGATCLECGVQYEGTEPCVGVKELNHDMGTGFDAEGNLAKKKRHKPPKDLLKWIRRDGGVLPSSKSAAVVEQIEKWLTEEPDKKIIVFCQWRMMMQIVAQDCKKQGIGYCNYHGGMSDKQRDKAVSNFATEPGKQVLVASLKCGGLGLNLTMASKIICVDLWFNSFIEQQAFCRIFRIGQESETYINRLVLKGTVDERLVALQERKKKLIGRALGDTQAFKHFSAEDLMRLFGHVKRDEHDRPFIVVDDEEGRTAGEEEPANDL